MDLPQPTIPHRTADHSAGRVARRTEVAAPPSHHNHQLKTLLRQARRYFVDMLYNNKLNIKRSNVEQYTRQTVHRAYSTNQHRPRHVRYNEYNGESSFRKGNTKIKTWLNGNMEMST